MRPGTSVSCVIWGQFIQPPGACLISARGVVTTWPTDGDGVFWEGFPAAKSRGPLPLA